MRLASSGELDTRDLGQLARRESKITAPASAPTERQTGSTSRS